jgi:hypothetical protein
MSEQTRANQTTHIETKSLALDPNQGPVDVSLDHPFLQKKLILLNGFSNEEIGKIMHAVKGLYNPPEDLIFAKTTKNSLQMVLKDLIVDISSDHEYLKQNPPKRS